jgi:hypothetical protein
MKVDVFLSRSIPAAGPPEIIESVPQVFIQMTLGQMRTLTSDLGDLDPARMSTHTKELARLLKESDPAYQILSAFIPERI